MTVAIDDPKRTDTHEDEALFTESALCLPLKELPQYGTLLVRFADVTGHGLGLQYVQLQLSKNDTKKLIYFYFKKINWPFLLTFFSFSVTL